MEVNSVGRKIKYFRVRANFSQLDLELALGAAQGSISRIESGKVNPTKETINHIASILGLNSREQAFLLVDNDGDIPREEIDNAILTVRSHFARSDVYAYL
jgi:transcriptional regulator with XRE-family HTH domain